MKECHSYQINRSSRIDIKKRSLNLSMMWSRVTFGRDLSKKCKGSFCRIFFEGGWQQREGGRWGMLSQLQFSEAYKFFWKHYFIY